MVFAKNKKAATPAKNAQIKKKGKKAFEVKEEEDDLDMLDMEDFDDDDSEDDSDEEMVVQKTPAGKTPKGQSLNEKRVSFQIPSAKNSPALKTPKKDNGIVRTQVTPGSKGKASLQEFKGMKGNKTTIKKEDSDEDDDDDDDDEEEDDDLDLELDDDDEEEDDDDDDDDEDEDDDSPVQNKSPAKTPIKTGKTKNAATPKGAKTPTAGVTPKVEIKKEVVFSAKNNAKHMDEMARRRERDLKLLYVGGLPKDVTADELKVLSGDIEDVILPSGSRKGKYFFAFLQFASEAKAESNHAILQSKKLRGQLLNIDFAGLKSKNKKDAEPAEAFYHKKKLFVSGIPLEATLAQVAIHFPSAFQVTFNNSPIFRNASVNFYTEEDANEAFTNTKEIDVNGHKLTVLHAVLTSSQKRHQNRKSPKWMKKGGNPPKKFKKSGSDEE